MTVRHSAIHRQPRLHISEVEGPLSFLLSVAALTVVYLVVAKLERTPALRFRSLPSPRPYLATDTAWYLLAILATAVSVFLFRPVLSQLAIGSVSERVNALPLAARFL